MRNATTIDLTCETKNTVEDAVYILRNNVSGILHDKILRQMLIEECDSELRLNLTVRELIEKLSS